MLCIGSQIHRSFIGAEVLRQCYDSINSTVNRLIGSIGAENEYCSAEEMTQRTLLQIERFDLEDKIKIRQAVAKSDCIPLIRERIIKRVQSDNAKISLKIFSGDIVFSLPQKAWPLRNWHQESYADSRICLVAHLALSVSNASTGGLRVYNGRRITQLLPHVSFKDDGGNPHHRRIVDQDFFESNHKQLELAAGDLAILDGLIPHAGGNNTSNLPRIFYALRFMAV